MSTIIEGVSVGTSIGGGGTPAWITVTALLELSPCERLGYLFRVVMGPRHRVRLDNMEISGNVSTCAEEES